MEIELDRQNPFNLPEKGDILFNEMNANYRHNATIRSGISCFFLYSDSYKEAASKLFEQIDGDVYYTNILVYPLVFLSRHFLELRLKELISGLNYAVTGQFNFPKGHKLLNLWCEYKRLVIAAGEGYGPEKIHLENTEKLIIEFDSVDPGSMSFRYPVDAEKKPSLAITNLDLENFRLTMGKLFRFFDMQSEAVFHLVDLTQDFFNEMRAQYLQQMSIEYY